MGCCMALPSNERRVLPQVCGGQRRVYGRNWMGCQRILLG